jgi:hypothetical protein
MMEVRQLPPIDCGLTLETISVQVSQKCPVTMAKTFTSLQVTRLITLFQVKFIDLRQVRLTSMEILTSHLKL